MPGELRPSAKKFKEKVGQTPVVILEAGVYRGYYSDVLYKNFICKRLYLMDKWYTEYENGKYKVPNILELAKQAMEFFDKQDNVMIIKADSLLFDLWPDNYFDYIYLDNDHSYSHCVKEFPKYWGHLKEGGMLSGDNLEAPGVYKALNEFCKENNLHYYEAPWKVNQQNGNAIASDWWIWK